MRFHQVIDYRLSIIENFSYVKNKVWGVEFFEARTYEMQPPFFRSRSHSVIEKGRIKIKDNRERLKKELLFGLWNLPQVALW